jgi:hypothetical protein
MVLDAKAAAAAPNNGFGAPSPFDDASGLRDPRRFVFGTSDEMISVVLYAWALSAEFPNLGSRLAKYVNEDDPLAGEAGLDEDGYQIVTPSAALAKRAAEQNRKRKAEDASSSIVEALTRSGDNMASAMRALAHPPAPAPPSAHDVLTARLCTAVAELDRLRAARGTVIAQKISMTSDEGKKAFTDEDRAELQAEFVCISGQMRAANAEVDRLKQEIARLRAQ